MANIVHGSSDKAKTDWFKETANEALRDRMTVRNGKGSRPRNNHSQSFRDNYDSIFRPKKGNEDESNSE